MEHGSAQAVRTQEADILMFPAEFRWGVATAA